MSLRVFIAVTHLLGAGHLTRAAAIARASAEDGHEVTLVSGGAPSGPIDIAGARFVQLPPVRAEIADFSTLRDLSGQPVDAAYRTRRRDDLLAALDATRPDVVVTELYPFGRRSLADEFEALLAAVDAMPNRPLVLCSIRDILAAPRRPGKAEATHDILRARYDGVLVHGDETVLPLDRSWPIPDDVRPLIRYTGFVGPERDACTPSRHHRESERILVSGGSSAAGLPLYRAALAAAVARPDLAWHILVGGSVRDADFANLVRDASGTVLIERARADFRDLLSKAAVFVGQAGYNTVMDIVATRARAVLVPFEQGGETEQRLRADALEAAGLVSVLTEDRLAGESLIAVVEQARRRDRPSFAGFRLDGATSTVRILERLVAGRTATAVERPLR